MSLSPTYLILGKLCREYLITNNDKSYIDQKGGNLLYAAGGAALWLKDKNEIGLMARVGENFPRNWINDLSEEKFNTEGIKILPEEIDLRSFRAYIDMRVSTTKDPIRYFAKLGIPLPKSLLGYQDPTEMPENYSELSNISLRESDLPQSYQFANAAHICSLDFMTHSLMPATLRQKGISTITLDPSNVYLKPNFWEKLPPIISGLTAFMPSEEDLRELFSGQSKDIWEMIEVIGDWGAEMVVVKRGEKGQYLYITATRQKYEIPAYPSRIVDLTGVGDAFSGGFLVGYKKAFDPVEAVLYGNVAASFAIEGSGSFYANDVLPSLPLARIERIKEMIRKI